MKKQFKLLTYLSVFAILISFAFTSISNKKIIVIDAAHGGIDMGASSGTSTEKEIVEKISKKVKALNQNKEIEIVLLRDQDNYIKLTDRLTAINSLIPDLMISLHINHSKDETENGISAFVSKKNQFYTKSVENADRLLTNIASLKLKRGTIKDSNFFLINKSNCPAVILELGYISNTNDKNYLDSEAGQTEIATKILNTIRNL